MKKLLLGLAASVSILGISAPADSVTIESISYSSPFSISDSNLEVTGLVRTSRQRTRTQTLFLSGFDPALGTLDSVILSVESTGLVTSYFFAQDTVAAPFNNTANGGSGRAFATLVADITDPSSGTGSSGGTGSASAGCSASSPSGSGAPSSCSDTGTRPFSFERDLTGGLSQFEIPNLAGGNVDLHLRETLVTELSSCDPTPDAGDLCGNRASISWTGTATITYQYLVPEPARLSLLAPALAALALRRRIRDSL